MDEFSHHLAGSSSRSAAPFSYFPSSPSPRHHHPPPPPPPPPPSTTYDYNNNHNPNPNPLRPKSESSSLLLSGSSSSSQNPYYHDHDVIKAKIISHPHYSALLAAYMDCQKVGAPPELAARLSAIAREIEARQQAAASCRRDATSAVDPELDQFMEAYCNMLMKYREELARPLEEGMDFLRRIESQLHALTNGPTTSIFSSPGGKCEGVGSSEEDEEGSGGEGGEASESSIDPRAEDKELKHHLLKKYSGYLSSLRHELSKKKKKGKLPKEARQKLLNWWELHYKWPYPSETEKVALAEATGLDQKQINNWFINQRKRHWKPSEDMQFVVMEAFHPQNSGAAFYMGSGQYMGDASYRLGP